MKENEDCWFEDKFGEYEFLPINELFEIDSDVDYETAKSEVEISCLPLNEIEIVSGKDPSVVKNKINKTIEKLNKNGNNNLINIILNVKIKLLNILVQSNYRC